MNKVQVIRVAAGTIAFECRTRIQADKWVEARRQLAGHDPSMYDIQDVD